MPELTRRIWDGLNDQQLQAVRHDDSPLLVLAGAGTGKTHTLVHRVAHLIERGVDPRRILLLTFTRRAAVEMLRRVDSVLRSLRDHSGSMASRGPSHQVWGGTFHAISTRLLRGYGQAIGLPPDFTILDRGDAEDLLHVVRTELGLHNQKSRFPKKGTCLSIYSYCVNAQSPLKEVLESEFPWCAEHTDALKQLFQAYVDRKDAAAVLDYDDLLLFWRGMLQEDDVAARVRALFDCVLVDEYQDTNQLQGDILQFLRPGGTGLTVVGDDCQAIYSFRAATIRNILDFPKTNHDTTIVRLEQNYRSTSPILAATNDVMAQAREQFTKELWTDREAGEKPHLITCEREHEQTDEIIRQILEHREAGIALREQAVLFRTAHHSIMLEAELARHNIPFVKYGGLKFMETAHVKDLLALLRLAENPKDVVAGARALMLLPGIGPKTSHQLLSELAAVGGDFGKLREASVPSAARSDWKQLIELLILLSEPEPPAVPAQVHAARTLYEPWLEKRYENADARMRDLEQVEQLASRFPTRQVLLADLALDPPSSTEDFAGPPHLDEDYLILSTFHSAKGLEWDAVYILHAADGNIPSDMATKNVEQIDEERRMFYVAMTRAKDWLYVYFPQRYYRGPRRGRGDSYNFAQLTRFLPRGARDYFDCRTVGGSLPPAQDQAASQRRKDIRHSIRSVWS